MRAALTVLLAACSFHPPGEQPQLDAPAPHDVRANDSRVADAMGDSFVARDCALETDDGSLDKSGTTGDNGGSPSASIECDAPTDMIVGIALQISNQNTVYGGRSALAIDISCAPVTVHPDQSATVGTIYTHEASGLGTYMWSPATLTSTAQCAADSVVTGIDAHTTGSNDMFEDVTITCSQLGPDGALTGSTAAIYIAGSQTDAQGDTPASCNTGDVLRRLDPDTGAGLDSVTLRCAPAQCQP